MRKIYSIVLMACALLVSVSLSAAVSKTLPAGNQTSLFQEFVNLDDDVEITLTGDVNLTSTVNIYSGKKITLNLNGHNIEGSFKGTLIILYHGNLDITGTGVIKNTSTADPAQCIQVEGQMDHNVADWSVLTIGENVTVIANEAHGKAIVIDGTVYAPYYTYVSQEFLGAGRFVATDYISNASNYEANALTTKKNATSISTVAGTAMYSTLGYATKVPVYNDVATTLYKKGESSATSGKQTTLKSLAYGVKVVVNGHVSGGEYGIKTNGTVVLDTDNNTDNMASVIVSSTSTVEALNSAKSAGIASNGYSHYTINGEVRGGTGVYVKGGEVDIQDAVIASTYQGEFNDKIIGAKSGVNAGGTGIVIESNVAYAGGQKVTISGDTKVSGTCGYGIQETVTTGTGDEVSSVTVLGGTIEAGDQGAMIFDKSTLSSGDDKIQIVGGNVHSEIYVLDEEGQKVNTDIKEFIPEGNYSTTEVTDPKTGKTTIVVTELADGVAIDETGMTVAAAAAAGKGIKWTGTSEKLEKANATKVTLPYLEINDNKTQTLTVEEGVTLTVGRVVMGTQAQIIVKAGARLIVDGKQGIVAPVVSNLVLETSETTPAQFLFNPNVESNRHPNATVSLIANSYTSATEPKVDYLYQRFGVPTYNAVKNVTAKKDGADVQVFFRIYENNGWTSLGYLNVAGQSLRKDRLNTPFGYYTLQCNTPEVGTVVSFEGELMGNDNAALATGANTNGWSTFANSYSANLNMESMLSMFDGLPEGSNAAIYFQKNQAGTDNMFDWNIIDQTKLLVLNSSQIQALINLNPMQSFLIKDPASDITMSLNYKTMVWEPATGTASGAPRRAMSNLTKAAINLSYDNAAHDAVYMIQGDEFSAEIESGYDSEKYMSGKANIYVMNDKKYATCATNDLENTYIGFSCAEAGNYTISFENIAGEGLALVDMVANKVIDMTEGAEYEFYAQESNDYRFKVVGRNNVSTAVENVENAATKAAGVYTLTGMYLGNMSVWNTLPAGVYVVDGEKRVK